MATLIVRIPVATAAEQERLIAAFKTLRARVDLGSPPAGMDPALSAAVYEVAGIAEYVEAGVIVERADEVTFWNE